MSEGVLCLSFAQELPVLEATAGLYDRCGLCSI
jgi:hypothetical protein